MMKKFICLVLTVVLTCCMAVSVFASCEEVAITDEIGARYAYTNRIESTLSISSKMQLVNQQYKAIPKL